MRYNHHPPGISPRRSTLTRCGGSSLE